MRQSRYNNKAIGLQSIKPMPWCPVLELYLQTEFVCVCMRVCVYKYISVCACMFVYMCLCMYIYILCVYIYIYIYMSIVVYVCMCICVCVYTVYVCVNIYVCMRVHKLCVCVYMCVLCVYVYVCNVPSPPWSSRPCCATGGETGTRTCPRMSSLRRLERRTMNVLAGYCHSLAWISSQFSVILSRLKSIQKSSITYKKMFQTDQISFWGLRPAIIPF